MTTRFHGTGDALALVSHRSVMQLMHSVVCDQFGFIVTNAQHSVVTDGRAPSTETRFDETDKSRESTQL